MSTVDPPSSSGFDFRPGRCFVGYFVVWSVTPGAAYAADVGDQRDLVGDRGRRAAGGPGQCSLGELTIGASALGSRAFGFRADLACVNIFGGFLVTQRMLAMYKKKAKK
jgi:NAD(P) transhydrogenase subunit alpha